MRKLLVIALATLAAFPFASSSTTFAREDAIAVIVGSPAAADGHLYDVRATAGDLITVTVAWRSPAADLDIRVLPPVGGSCRISPSPDAPCFVEQRLAADVACSNARRALDIGPAKETVTLPATTTGTYLVAIVASVATPQLLEYRVEIAVDGVGGAVTGPEEARFLAGNAACKLPLADTQ